TLSGADHVELKQAVCRNAPAIANCERDLVIELEVAGFRGLNAAMTLTTALAVAAGGLRKQD
ncbi:MAG: hypothetical protein AAFR52_12090, partial [Pseudomonadota bacterium]